MSEVPDVYADQFTVNLGPYGSVLNFSASAVQAPAPGTPATAERVASVRMSLEHLKVMTYILRRQVIEYERQMRLQVPIPQDVLNALRVGREDWEAMWSAPE